MSVTLFRHPAALENSRMPIDVLNARRLVATFLLLTAASTLSASPSGDTTAVESESPEGATPEVASQTVSTRLVEVRRGTVDGQEFLSLDLEHQPVGPAACRSRTVTSDTSRLGEPARSNRIETMALSAILRSAQVEITISLDAELCVDGKPVFTDLQPLPRSP